MEKKYYTAKYFRDSIPEWKFKKDPLIAQWFYRPFSFYISAFCANRGISANTVSYFSMFIAIAACVCYFVDNHIVHIWGAVLVNLWLLLDCVDGNIARSVKKQPFGEFADAGSSYLLISFIYISIGFAIYEEGGLIISKGNVIILILAVLATVSNAFMLSLYHKFKEEIALLKIRYPDIADIGKLRLSKPGEMPSWKERIGESIGIGGFLPAFILLFTILRMSDIIIYFVFVINISRSCAISLITIRNAIKMTSRIENEK